MDELSITIKNGDTDLETNNFYRLGGNIQEQHWRSILQDLISMLYLN
jgi:hypothetical protein